MNSRLDCVTVTRIRCTQNALKTFIISLALITTGWSQDVNDMDLNQLLDMDLDSLLSMEVTVASKRAESQTDAPAIISTVCREEIGLYGDRNLHQILQRQPSVYTRGSYFYPNNLASFRGNMPSHVDTHTLILFNGRPMRESLWGGFNFPTYMTFPLDSLESIEIIRGPGSVMYGSNAFTGVVNLKPRPIPHTPKGSISAQTGSHGVYTTDVSLGGKNDQWGYTAHAHAAGQKGYAYAMTDGQGVYGSHSDRFDSFSGTSRFECGNFSVDLFASHLDTFHMGGLPNWSFGPHEIRVNRLFCNAGYRHTLDEFSHLEFNLTYNLQEADFSSYSTGDSDENTSDVLIESTWFYYPNDRLYLTIGYTAEHQKNFSEDGSGTSKISRYHYRPQNAYGEMVFRLNEQLKWINGLQWNRASNHQSDLVSRTGLIFTPHRQWGIKLLRGEAFRAPVALETAVDDGLTLVGNPDLKPETITTYDVQLFYQQNRTYAALTFFDSTIEDLISRDTSVSPTSFKNGGEQRYQGVELEVKHFLNTHWHIQGSATHQNNKQTSDLNDSTAPDEMVKLGSGYTWDWGSAAFFATYFSKPPRLVTEVIRNPEPDALVLISANLLIDPYRWIGQDKGRMQMELKLENLLDEDVWVPEFNRSGNPNSLPDGPGFTIYGGLTWNF